MHYGKAWNWPTEESEWGFGSLEEEEDDTLSPVQKVARVMTTLPDDFIDKPEEVQNCQHRIFIPPRRVVRTSLRPIPSSLKGCFKGGSRKLASIGCQRGVTKPLAGLPCVLSRSQMDLSGSTSTSGS